MTQNQYIANALIKANSKSVGLAFTLAFLFGPFGLLYVSIPWALWTFFGGLVLVAITGGLGAFAIWITCMIAAVSLAQSHNRAAALETAKAFVE
jgi:hypothetical protein